MKITKEPYAGHSEEDDGYYECSGVVCSFTEGEREYRFNVEDSMPEYASSLPSLVSGRQVTVMVHAPHAESSAAIEIPTNCPLFSAALRELQRVGVRYVSFFNQTTGGFSQFKIEELGGA